MNKEHFVQVETQTYRLRLLALFGILALTYWTSSPGLNLWLVVLATVGYLAYAITLHYTVIPRFYRSYLIALMMAADFMFAAAVVNLLGLDSVGFLVFPLTVIYHAIYLGYLGSMVSATVAAVVSLLLAWQNWEPGVVSIVAFRLPLLYMVALFTGYMAQQRLRERDAKLALQGALRAEQKARELVTFTQELKVDPERMLQNIVEVAARVTGARQCLVLLRPRLVGGKYYEGRAAFPQTVEGGIADILSVKEPTEGHWIHREGGGNEATVLAGDDVPAWVQLAVQELVGVPLKPSGEATGVMYCLPGESLSGSWRDCAIASCR